MPKTPEKALSELVARMGNNLNLSVIDQNYLYDQCCQIISMARDSERGRRCPECGFIKCARPKGGS